MEWTEVLSVYSKIHARELERTAEVSFGSQGAQGKRGVSILVAVDSSEEMPNDTQSGR